MKTLLFVLTAWCLAMSVVYADPPEGKGKDKDKPEQSQGRGQDSAPGQQKREEAAASRSERSEAKAENRADRAAARADNAAEARVERQHPHQDRQAREHADRGTGADERRADRSGDHRQDREDHGREAARQRVASLVDSLKKLEHARWSFNPHDTRGQGNMGKVDMRDPFGFDKDSDREGRDRGRPIRETESPPRLNLSELVTVDFDFYGSFWQDALQSWVDYYQAVIESMASYESYYTSLGDAFAAWYASYMEYLQSQVSYYQGWIEYYSTFDTVSAIKPWATIDYTVSLPTAEEFAGTTLLVTTRLTSLSNYDDVVSWDTYWYGDESGWGADGWFDFVPREEQTVIHYEVGDIVVEETQEVTLGEQNVFSVSYNPPNELVGDEFGWGPGGGFFVELSVIVTDPSTGQSVTYTYDRDINLYRCPYGIVYDKTTGRPIAGATVTIHNADGSIVLLDKASNPNVSNPQMTDATGRYNAKLAIGQKYYLTVKAPGYEEYKSPLFSERWHIVREDVGLTPLKTSEPEATPAVTSLATTGIKPTGGGEIPRTGLSLPAGQ